jgi:hypothetical protein
MTDWYINFSEKPIVDNSIIKSYVELLKIISTNKPIEDNIQTKVCQLENDYEENLKNLETICSNQEFINNFKLNNSLVILQKELEIIKILTKYALQNNQLDYNFFLASLKYIFQLSEVLRERLGQKEIIHDAKVLVPNNLPRCSYKFCSYKDTCTYNYNATIKSQCYQDHFVHRMVSADLSILIAYIEQKYQDQNFVIHNKEILKTINTLSFVINHMESELRAKCMYLDEKEWEAQHFVKNLSV